MVEEFIFYRELESVAMPPEIINAITNGGMAMGPVFAVLWWLERDERKAAQTELKTVTEKVVAAMVETKSALGTFSSLLNPINRGR